jgi:hypothetical protein
MKIANPIYDVVFKYLLDDNRIAKLIIGKIIEEEILELEFQPTETKTNIDKRNEINFAIYRLDFAAKIKTDDGYKKILIEIQKAKFPTDILRFRKYLGSQYSSENNIIKDENDDDKALPIITIYFLCHNLEHTEAPIIKVKRNYLDASTNEKIDEKEEFIESLTHDSFIIQIPKLAGKRRTELEMILSIFDQTGIFENHFIKVDKEKFPKKYAYIIDRLQKAILDEDLEKEMDIQDEFLRTLEKQERKYLRTIEEQSLLLESKDQELAKLKQELDKLKK